MTEKGFISTVENPNVTNGSHSWQSPSNIALVKYWGKKEGQIPANASISFTLDQCRTITTLEYSRREPAAEDVSFELYFEGKKKEDFRPKIASFFSRIKKYCPFLTGYHFVIRTENTFPHSSGIASSASGMSALAVCVMSLEKELNPDISDEFFRKKASFLARLGSGSACRSIEGELVVWGSHPSIEDSSDLYGIPYPSPVHAVFRNYQDTILLVDKGEKQVSSSVGHNLMHGHPFAESRFQQAQNNLSKLTEIFSSGDLDEFIEVVESEALSLHAMMMCSRPYFILMRPNTLQIINRIWEFRKQNGVPVCFTLDAGANVHVLYPEKDRAEVLKFIKDELVAYCENGQYICDNVGKGAKKP
jgi:diphosphomevalonate decarboxylase